MNYQDIVSRFNMLPHPEGGFYKELYRSAEVLPKAALPNRFDGDRVMATGIYFLLLANNFSAFHRIKSDELWHFYTGGSLLVHVLHPNGNYQLIKLGNRLENGEVFQAMVPAGSWFASECAAGQDFSFVGCTVAPGFDFADFELAYGAVLTAASPTHQALIERLCRQ